MLDRAWFSRDAPIVAVDLLDKVLRVHGSDVFDGSDGSRGTVSGRIVETEAYMPDDPASHTFNGPTERNRVMFGPAGHLYVYLSYGIHRCANVVTGDVGSGQAVLIRAIAPIEGLDTMRSRRGPRADRVLADGPGKLCQALDIGVADNGADLVGANRIEVIDDGMPPPSSPRVGPRIGITRAMETPWRFRVPDPSRRRR